MMGVNARSHFSSSLRNAVPSRRTAKRQEQPSGHLTESAPSVRRSKSGSIPFIVSSRSHGSTYLKEIPGTSNRKRHQLTSLETTAEAPIASLMAPTVKNSAVRRPSGGLAKNETPIRHFSTFHLFSSDIASSTEESMVSILAEGLGIAEALSIAADFGWTLSARFYNTLQSEAAVSSSAKSQT